nr:MAG TPA: Putative transferase, nesg, ydcK, Structural Genomics.38A [Caudoviricetes sp.]
MKKYELTTECKEFLERKLYRIKALTSFSDVKEGDLGGWIEKEENLSQEGNAWVYGDARVCGNATVYDNAMVYGNAEIKKRTHLLEIGSIGSRNDVTTFFRTKDKEIFVKCGCFKGNIDDFEKQVQRVHCNDKHGRVYALAIAMAKEQIELDDEDMEAEDE